MKPLLRALALGMGPVMVAAGVWALSQAGERKVNQIAFPIPVTAACKQPPVFIPSYQRGPGYVQTRGEGFYFARESILMADVCSAGTLEITGSGEVGGDEEPQLTVLLNSTILASPKFNQLRKVDIYIPYAGRVYLGYLNDYHLADTRIAILGPIEFISSMCDGFESINVPKTSGGAWSPSTKTAYLVRSPPMTLIPCGVGTLTMRVRGQEGNKDFPILRIEQNNEVISLIKTKKSTQEIRLPIQPGPVEITIVNPYEMTLENRSLSVQRLKFIPKNHYR